MVDKDVLPGKKSDPFRSFKPSRKPGLFGSVFVTLLATVWWCAAIVSAHLLMKPNIRRAYEDNPLSVFRIYVNLFKGLSVEEVDAASSSLFALLAAVAGVAIVMRDMVWEVPDLPEGMRMRRAWLQRAIDTSAREDAAVFFMFMLCGLYGFIVVCYGFLIGGKDWKGFGSAIFLILVVLSLFISALPAFVVKSDVGIVSNYTYNLVRLANVAEFRYRNESGGTRSFKVEKGGDVRWFGRVARAFAFEVPKGCGYIVGRYSGVLLTVALPVVVLVRRCLAPESNSNDRDIGQGFAFLVTSVFLAAFFELMILFALYVKAESISVGGFNFQQSVLPVLVAILSFSWSVMYVSMIFNALYRWWVVVVVAASPPLWWFVRFLLVLFMKPFGEVVHNDVSGIKKKFHQLCACLEDRSGLRGVMMVSVDQCLLECRSSVNSCVDRNVQIAAELNAVFDQVIPEKYVVNRIRDDGEDGEIESKSLRNYLSEVVKVTLPLVPETGSGAGK